MSTLPHFCCYSCLSLAEETWRKTQTDLSSGDKNKKPAVKEKFLYLTNFPAVEKWIWLYQKWEGLDILTNKKINLRDW
jgi:hypothetical protein